MSEETKPDAAPSPPAPEKPTDAAIADEAQKALAKFMENFANNSKGNQRCLCAINAMGAMLQHLELDERSAVIQFVATRFVNQPHVAAEQRAQEQAREHETKMLMLHISGHAHSETPKKDFGPN